MNHLLQIVSVTAFAIRTIPQRKGSSLAAAFGIAGVVLVLVGVLSIGQGFRRTMTITGSADRAVVLRSGSDSEMMSTFSGEEARIIQDAPGGGPLPPGRRGGGGAVRGHQPAQALDGHRRERPLEIGRASCRERV